MQRQMLKSKIHRATVTARDPDYVGSVTLDAELMRQADLLPAGDKVIVISYASYDERELDASSLVVVHVDERKRIVGVDSDPEVLLSEVPS
ncbi:MAG TPA: aspartate 1-decarboxylase [Solirubrobacterales bacterium]|nr:aspartate 1-decarboxylase [Solirubrobacterales bacterium]